MQNFAASDAAIHTKCLIKHKSSLPSLCTWAVFTCSWGVCLVESLKNIRPSSASLDLFNIYTAKSNYPPCCFCLLSLGHFFFFDARGVEERNPSLYEPISITLCLPSTPLKEFPGHLDPFPNDRCVFWAKHASYNLRLSWDRVSVELPIHWASLGKRWLLCFPSYGEVVILAWLIGLRGPLG